MVEAIPGGRRLLTPGLTKLRIVKGQREILTEARALMSLSGSSPQARVCVIYDNRVSTTVYGDFLYVVTLARWLLARGVAVEFWVSAAEFRSDFRVLSSSLLEKRVDDMLLLARALLPSATVFRIRGDQVESVARTAAQDGKHVIFGKCVQTKLAYYPRVFDLLTHLVPKLTRTELDRFLYTASLTQEGGKSLENAPYISLAVRHSTKWSPERNTHDDLLVQCGQLVQEYLSGHRLLVVSDEEGCDYFQRVATREGVDCGFSSEHRTNVLDDLRFKLNSAFSVQLPMSGTGVPVVFSRTPFLIYGAPVHEHYLLTHDRTPWQRDDQQWVLSNFPATHTDFESRFRSLIGLVD